MKSSEYWAKRQEDRMQRMHWRANKTVNKVNKAFDESQVRLKSEVSNLISKFDGVGMEEAKKYLNEFITYDRYKDLLEIYNTTEDKTVREEIGRMLSANATGYRIRRKEALQQSIERERLAMTGAQLDSTKAHLSSVYKDTLTEIGFNDVSRELINEALQSKWLGGNYSSRIWHNQKVMAKYLEDNILQGFVSGKSYSDMANELVTMTNYGKFAANRLIRTETSYIVNKADLEGSKRRGIKAKKFEANLDSRTSKVCREHNQLVIPIDKIKIGENAPPLHPFCRSFLSDLLEGWDYETDEELDKMISVENNEKIEIATDKERSHKGIDKSVQIDKTVIYSNEYDRKFNKLNESKNISKIIEYKSKEILEHRNGTKYEDLVFVNSRTGETCKSVLSETEQSVKPTKKMKKLIDKCAPNSIIAIHNHPESTLPSGEDIYVSYLRKYKYGLVVGHDGSIIKYKTTKHIEEIDVFAYNLLLDKYNKNKYNDVKEFINDVVKKFGVEMEVL